MSKIRNKDIRIHNLMPLSLSAHCHYTQNYRMYTVLPLHTVSTYTHQ